MKKIPVFIWQDRVLKKINPDDIHCLVTVGNYTNIFVAPDKRVMVRCTLNNALKKLPAGEFIKTNRSYAVSIYYIQEVARDHVKIEGIDIPLSKRYYKPLIAKLSVIA